MGFLLKEALKTLCARNQWSYAVFWKIGCNNSKLLIWEDCYYEPLPSHFLPQIVGTSNLPYRDGEGCWFSSDSQLRIQEDDRVGSLINKMMVNNSVNVAGQGSVLSFICLYHRLFRFRILILNALCHCHLTRVLLFSVLQDTWTGDIHRKSSVDCFEQFR